MDRSAHMIECNICEEQISSEQQVSYTEDGLIKHQECLEDDRDA